jgi:hypothetical protein
VNFVYEPRRRLPKAPEIGFGALISQFSSDWNGREVVRKLVDSSTRVERLIVGGSPALWIEGRHFFMYQSGSVPQPLETLRLATNVLVVRRGRTYVRIESALSRPRVIEIARSLRPA